MRPYLGKTLHKNMAGGVAQGEGPEFKPQYCSKNNNNNNNVLLILVKSSLCPYLIIYIFFLFWRKLLLQWFYIYHYLNFSMLYYIQILYNMSGSF
jgi:hypothetical protein